MRADHSPPPNRHAFALVLLLAAAGCTVDPALPAEAQISCASDADCPSADYLCQRASRAGVPRLCVLKSEADKAPTSSPALELPDGQIAVKDHDRLTVRGTCESGAVVVSARLVRAGSDEEALALPRGAVVAVGAELTGQLSVDQLTDATSVQLEVVVEAHGLASAPDKSRSLPVLVDNTRPGKPKLTLAPKVGSSALALTISSRDAVGLRIEGINGSLASPPPDDTWVPFTEAAVVQLSPGEGTRSLRIRVRDGAHNEESADAETVVDTQPPVLSGLALRPPPGQRDVKSGDTLTFAGSTEARSTLVSARLVDPAGAQVVNVTSQATLSPAGVISGAVTLGVLAAASLRLELLVSDGFNTSDPSASLSPAVTVDDAAPTLAVTADKVVNTTQLTLQLSGTGARELWVEGDVKPGPTTSAWIPFVTSLPVTLTDAEGSHSLTVKVRTGAFKEASQAVLVNVDRLAPLSAPRLAAPAGQLAVKETDSLQISGVVEAGAKLVLARLLDQAGSSLGDVTARLTVAPSGALGGSVPLAPYQPLAASRLVLEVLVTDGLNPSAPSASRSNAIDVDTVPPKGVSLSLSGKPVTGVQRIAVALSAVGATEVYLDGAVDDDAVTKEWIPLVSPVTVSLTAGDGLKQVTARFRDGAYNEVAAAPDSITLNTGPVVSNPTVKLPAGQLLAKNGDLLLLGGSGEPGAQVVSARLVDVDTRITALQLPASAVTINLAGILSGTVVASTLAHDSRVGLEVILSARGATSAPLASTSLPFTVDTAPPSNADVRVQQGQVVSLPDVTLLLGVTGASEVFLDGDLVDAVNVRQWIPVTTQALAKLAPGNGGKAIVARFRDGAFNVSQATAAVTLDNGVPVSRPTVHGLPWPVAKTKKDDVLTVGGDASAGTSLVSGSLVFFNAAGTELTSPATCSPSVTSSLTLAANLFSGSVVVPDPAGCPGAAQVALRIIVKNGAGTQSAASASTSNLLLLDSQPPAPGTASLKVVAPAVAPYSRTPTVILKLQAVEADGSKVQVFITDTNGLDLAQSPRVGAWVDFPGTEAVPGEEPVTLTTGDGLKTLKVQFRDVVQNVTAAATVTINLDTAPPGNPTPLGLKLVETSPAPNDPAQLAESGNTLAITGLPGAIVNGDRAELYLSSVAPANLLATVAALSDGSFATTAVPANASKSYLLTALDPAGNRSAPTTVVAPRFTAISATPSPARSGAPMTITFTSSSQISPAPTVTVGGRPATLSSGAGSTSWTYAFTPNGTEQSEGLNKAVVRISGGDPAFAAGNSGTSAATTTLDFTPPLFNAAKVTLTQNPPGQDDTLSGAAGTGSDAIAATASLLFRVYSRDGLSLITQGNLDATGAFATVLLGKNVYDGVLVTLVDTAGNETPKTAPQALFLNDIRPPVVTGLSMGPPIQKLGGTSTISFSLTDAERSDLFALPVVKVGGRAASWVSGTAGTSDGLAHPFVYSFTALADDGEQPTLAGYTPSCSTLADCPPTATSCSTFVGCNAGYPAPTYPYPLNVEVQVEDVSRNSALTPGTLLIDKSAPTSNTTLPGNNGSWSGLPSIQGTAADPKLGGGGQPSGIGKVQLSVERMSDLKFWNGTGFASSTELWLDAAGTTGWSYDTSQLAPALAAGSYQIRTRATDVAGNVEFAPVTRSFTYSAGGPAAPTALAATTDGELRIHLTWTAPAPAPASYRLYYDVEAGTHPPFFGTGATVAGGAATPSPLTVAGAATSLDVNDLPRGRWTFAITAVDGSGNESAYSGLASATSRAWVWQNPLPPGNLLRGVWGTGPADVWAVGDLGTIVHWDGSAWSQVTSGTAGDLYGVWGSSAIDVWAVGKGALLHWNGSAWSPAPGYPVGLTSFRAVWGSSSTDVWAVGQNGSGTNVRHHWNGTAWSSAVTSSSLYALWGTGANNLWSVGAGGHIRRWDGATWTITPSNTTAMLNGIWGSGPSDIWAVGDNGVTVHWDGAVWTPSTAGTPNNLLGVWGTSASNVWAVGSSGTILRWTGSSWSAATSGITTTLPAIWGSGPGDLWAVGAALLHGTGTANGWTNFTSGTTSALRGVWGSSAANVWAVGAGGTIQRWTGSAWAASISGTAEVLNGVWGSGPSDVWAAGNKGTIVRWTGSAWGPSSSGTTTNLRAVWGSGASDVWAVGEAGTVLHWSGSAWSTVPSTTTQTLNAVWGSGAGDVWAAGASGTLLHWNGTAWSAAASGSTSSLNGIWGSGPGDVWIASAAEVLHWNGSAWSISGSGGLAIWGSGATDVWIVGAAGGGFSAVRRHWNGSAWTQTSGFPPASVGATYSDLNGLWGSGPGDVRTVGNNGTILNLGPN